MGQGWPSILATDKVRLDRADIVERFETLRSLFDGETPPPDPIGGQPWRKTSTREIFIWDAETEEWEPLVKPSAGGAAGYVSPESYGAVGDGSTNDKQAFLDALATGKRVLGDPSKVYAIDGTMTICTAGNSAWLERCRFKQTLSLIHI